MLDGLFDITNLDALTIMNVDVDTEFLINQR